MTVMIRTFVFSFYLLFLPFAARAECVDFQPATETSAGHLQTFPSFLILGISAAVRDGGDQYIWSYPDLPNGGIQGEHICAPVSLVPFANGRTFASMTENDQAQRQALQIFGLQLHDGVDYRATYPAAYEQILERNQFFQFPGGVMWVMNFEEGSAPAAGSEVLNGLISENSQCETHSVLIADNTVLIPVC
ncbi:hypothetical protein [Gymnodinialimonas hymeniacidonis]|uniref:hypothetical protein n=1 Tax=Gymnodinialimonas hymeniacidonis TaxID=3126508 RepID=UPI0034C61173